MENRQPHQPGLGPVRPLRTKRKQIRPWQEKERRQAAGASALPSPAPKRQRLSVTNRTQQPAPYQAGEAASTPARASPAHRGPSAFSPLPGRAASPAPAPAPAPSLPPGRRTAPAGRSTAAPWRRRQRRCWRPPKPRETPPAAGRLLARLGPPPVPCPAAAARRGSFVPPAGPVEGKGAVCPAWLALPGLPSSPRSGKGWWLVPQVGGRAEEALHTPVAASPEASAESEPSLVVL